MRGLDLNGKGWKIGVMAKLTIRNLPDEVHERLKEQAKRNGRSLNQEVIAALGAREGHEVGGKQREMIAVAAALRKELKTPLTGEEIRVGIEGGRR